MNNLKKALELKKDGKLLESNLMIFELLKADPNNAQLNYRYACSFDVLGKETQAVPYYEKALKIGLPDVDKREAYLGLGSTYRCIGEYDKSIELFKKAILEFEDNSLKVFYAMALYNKKEYSMSTEILLKIIAEKSTDPSINLYKRAISYYSNKLDKNFD